MTAATLIRPSAEAREIPHHQPEPADAVRQLEARLEKGWQLLEGGRGSAEEIARWEESWLRLLRQYEALCDAAA